MKKALAVLGVGFALLASPAHSAVTFDFIFDGATPVSVSNDGSVVTGTLEQTNFPAFRWTQATGVVSLGRPQMVGGAGVPATSADGTRIAFGIGSLDGSYSTQGRWTLGSGWQDLMPPTPPDGGLSDGSYGSVWDISGDGNTVVGLYWRPGPGKRAHASKWTQATGVVDLGGVASGTASRANGVNSDGSVIAGWVETSIGPWRPAAWVNGSLVLLTDVPDPSTLHDGIGEAKATSSNGDIIVGFSSDPNTTQRAVSMWKRVDGVFGPTEILGWVDGSQPEYGINIPYAVSDDGNIVVGYCSFDGSPFNPTGFVWTPNTGVVDVNQWLADNGVLVDPNFTIQSLSAMTPDGKKIFGYGQMLTPPYTRRGFRITTGSTVGVPISTPAARCELSSPIPNPSSSSIRMDLALPSAMDVDLSVFDVSGRRLSTLVHGELPAGRKSVTWDGRETSGSRVPAGLYFARLVTPQGSILRRIVRMD